MNSSKQQIIHKKCKIIQITQTQHTKKKEDYGINEYSLTPNFFDPSKSSPPNEFMLKLKLRMSHYNSFNNVDSLISE